MQIIFKMNLYGLCTICTYIQLAPLVSHASGRVFEILPILFVPTFRVIGTCSTLCLLVKPPSPLGSADSADCAKKTPKTPWKHGYYHRCNAAKAAKAATPLPKIYLCTPQPTTKQWAILGRKGWGRKIPRVDLESTDLLHECGQNDCFTATVCGAQGWFGVNQFAMLKAFDLRISSWRGFTLLAHDVESIP